MSLPPTNFPTPTTSINGALTGDTGDVAQSSRLKRNRAVAVRYDELAVHYEATVYIAAINEWLLPDWVSPRGVYTSP